MVLQTLNDLLALYKPVNSPTIVLTLFSMFSQVAKVHAPGVRMHKMESHASRHFKHLNCFTFILGYVPCFAHFNYFASATYLHFTSATLIT